MVRSTRSTASIANEISRKRGRTIRSPAAKKRIRKLCVQVDDGKSLSGTKGRRVRSACRSAALLVGRRRSSRRRSSRRRRVRSSSSSSYSSSYSSTPVRRRRRRTVYVRASTTSSVWPRRHIWHHHHHPFLAARSPVRQRPAPRPPQATPAPVIRSPRRAWVAMATSNIRNDRLRAAGGARRRKSTRRSRSGSRKRRRRRRRSSSSYTLSTTSSVRRRRRRRRRTRSRRTRRTRVVYRRQPKVVWVLPRATPRPRIVNWWNPAPAARASWARPRMANANIQAGTPGVRRSFRDAGN